ncbi:MAG: GMC family oxidoreductase [Acidimicrobiia bacterium]
MAKGPGFDVLIVGGGPAGAVLANRLTADANRSVLLVEAGPDYGGDVADWPADLLFSQQQPLTSHSWGLHDAGSGNFLPRARLLGGSSAVNACYWIRGSAADYDEWEARGNPGWGFDDLLPYFRKAESDPLGGPLHGTDGPVQVWRASDWSPGDLAFTEAADSLGMIKVEDINGAREQIPSVGPVPKNIVADNRFNAVLSYLAPARDRANLTVKTDTLVDKVRFAGEKAIGIVTGDGDEFDADLVVLAAGAYFTPGILNRSGYGHDEDLRSLGIPVRQHLPGVGQNLLDHPFSIDIATALIVPEAEHGKVLQGQAMARSRSESSPGEIDCHLYNGQSFDTELGRWVMGLSVSMVNARSTGIVSLTSTDPNQLPHVEHRHYSEQEDLERMCNGIEMSMEIFSSSQLAPVIEPEGQGGWTWSDRKSLEEQVRQQSQTTNHCSGTAKIGPDGDPLAVADQSGHVYGSDNLVVADSSLFPTCPRGNIHFPVVAAAEKIAAGLA